ncbi:MAG: hypothetical protein WCV92_03630 [Candidatus Buchananbacteria bacterium]
MDVIKAVQLLEFLTAFSKSDSRSYSKDDVAERRKGLVNVEDDWLIERLNQSFRSDWQSKPNFYHALVAELQKRKII